MCETKIILRDIDSIRSFVRQVIQVDFEVDLLQGRYLIDAKSIMGIFSLDLSRPLDLYIHEDKDAPAILEALEPYILKN